MAAGDDWQSVHPNGPEDDDWCSINEAARRLNVTPTAIRNRIKRGTLETRARGNEGREVRVPKPVARTVPETVSETVPLTVSEAYASHFKLLASLVDALREQIARTEGAADEARERELAELRDQLEAERAKTAEADGRARELAGALAEVRAERAELRGQVERLAAGRADDAAAAAALRVELEAARRRWWHAFAWRRSNGRI